MKNKKISDLSQLSQCDGSELLVFAKNGDNGAMTTGTLKDFAQKGMSPKEALFIDMWNSAIGDYGKYNAETGYFELNGLTDITYEEALAIYKFGDYNSMINLDKAPSYLLGRRPPLEKIRTTLPSVTNNNMPYATLQWTPKNLKVIRFGIPNRSGAANTVFVANDNIYIYNTPLIAILDMITPNKAITIGTKESNYNQTLKTIYIYHLGYNITINSPAISFESLQYMITNAVNSSHITITVHPDVYAKLTGDTTNAAAAALTPEEAVQWQQLVTDAAAKQITLAK